LKIEADGRKIYETWRLPFMDKNKMAVAGFYYTNVSHVVRCALCGLEVCHWSEGEKSLKEHQI